MATADEISAAISRVGWEEVYHELTDDPIKFSTAVLGLKPWSKQAEVLENIAKHDRVAVRSGHKVGKSTLAAIAALWWVHRWTDGRVVLTAPTARQVRIVLWREIRRLYGKAAIPLGGKMNQIPELGFQLGDADIVGLSTDEPEKIAGVSGAHVLYIVDEGSGVIEELYEAIEGSRAGGAKLLVLGNPTRTSGSFYEAFRSPLGWVTMHISSEHSPNVTGECSIPGLATPGWVQEKLLEWGEDSPLFQVRVRGNFPTQAENSVIGLGLVEDARRRYDETSDEAPLVLGVDVARFGDDETVVYPVRGKKALRAVAMRSRDNVAVAGEVTRIARELARGEEWVTVRVDTIGVGAGVADILRSNGDLGVVDVNAGEAATSDQYARVRDEVWFALREWLKEGGAIPEDDMLHAELLAPTYSFLPTGKIRVESKDEIKKRLPRGRSTDRADALGLAIYAATRKGPAWLYD